MSPASTAGAAAHRKLPGLLATAVCCPLCCSSCHSIVILHSKQVVLYAYVLAVCCVLGC